MARYNYKSSDNIAEALWNEETCVRRQGGYMIDVDTLPSGMKVLPKGSVLAVNSDGEAIYVKTAVVQANAAKDATTLTVLKGSELAVGDVIAGSAISAINTTNSAYDSLTVAALGAAVTKDAVLNTSIGNGIIGLNYAPVVIDDAPSCTVTLQAYDIDEASMPRPVNDTIKSGLTSRHSFLGK